MTATELAEAWHDLITFWAINKGRYNAPGIATAAGITKNRFYAAMGQPSGGGTAKRTELLYLQISDALSFRYYRPGQKATGKPNPVELRREYATNGLATLAGWYGVPVGTVRGWLQEYSIPLRAQGERPLPK